MCPVCNKKGIEVKSITVKHLVLDTVTPNVINTHYYLCTNENCDVVYYSSDPDVQIRKSQIKVPIWFKKEANPKYICYCNKVTEEQIIDAVRNQEARSIKDIIKLTGAMKNGKCELNHPTGKCCSPIIKETIDKAL